MAGKAKKPTPTPAKAWRQPREEGYLIPLPSGNVARLRPVALDVLILSGELPDLLSPIAAKMLWEDLPDVAEIANAAELATGTAKLMNHVCRAAMMEPPVAAMGEEPKDGEIALEDIDFQDKSIIFQLAISPAVAMRNFRDRQAAGLDAVPDGESNGDKAE